MGKGLRRAEGDVRAGLQNVHRAEPGTEKRHATTAGQDITKSINSSDNSSEAKPRQPSDNIVGFSRARAWAFLISAKALWISPRHFSRPKPSRYTNQGTKRKELTLTLNPNRCTNLGTTRNEAEQDVAGSQLDRH